jgi:hypothetical protein
LSSIAQASASIVERYYQLHELTGPDSLQSPVIYQHVDPPEALAEAAKRRQLLDSLRYLRRLVPDNACIYSTATAQTMLYSKRRAVLTPAVNGPEQLTLCRYILTIAWESGHRDAFFPLSYLQGNEQYELAYISEHDGRAILLLYQRLAVDGANQSKERLPGNN